MPDVNRTAPLEDRRVLARIPLHWAHVADAFMAVLNVVPTGEIGRLAARFIEIVEAALGELRSVPGTRRQYCT